ncbi:hypothetical protein HOD29_01265 [archaeon]|jgi:hypothetical protein|nr:hypothetical protein [archaeon]
MVLGEWNEKEILRPGNFVYIKSLNLEAKINWVYPGNSYGFKINGQYERFKLEEMAPIKMDDSWRNKLDIYQGFCIAWNYGHCAPYVHKVQNKYLIDRGKELKFMGLEFEEDVLKN